MKTRGDAKELINFFHQNIEGSHSKKLLDTAFVQNKGTQYTNYKVVLTKN